MTDENRRRNIADEVTRADEAYRSADILQRAGQHADAVSRAYYACFHYARALLLMRGEEPRRHGGIDRLLQRDLVSPGKLKPEVARNFSRLQQYRLHADYTAGYAFTQATAADELDAAQVFCAAARALLVAEGWIAP